MRGAALRCRSTTAWMQWAAFRRDAAFRSGVPAVRRFGHTEKAGEKCGLERLESLACGLLLRCFQADVINPKISRAGSNLYDHAFDCRRVALL